jgi:hypothetical protein
MEKNSFIGFSFGDRHSSSLGILRVISDRHEETLIP